MATVNVSTFGEFLSAIRVSGDTVVCPYNAIWDLTNQLSMGYNDIMCAEIQGNGTTLKGISFNHIAASSSSKALFRIRDTVKIKNLNIIDFEGYSSSYDGDPFALFFMANNNDWMHTNTRYLDVIIEQCEFNGKMHSRLDKNDIALFYWDNNTYYVAIQVNQCVLELDAPSGGVIALDKVTSSSSESTSSWEHIKFLESRMKIKTKSSLSPGNLYGYNPFAFDGNVSQTRTPDSTINPIRVANCEIVLNAPNVGYLELVRDRSNYTAAKYIDIDHTRQCVVRGYCAANASISARGNSYRNANVYQDTIGTLDITDTTGRSVSDAVLKSYDLFSEAISGIPFDLYTSSTSYGYYKYFWHVGESEMNYGYPYIPNMYNVPRIPLIPVPQNPYIHLFLISTQQHQFENAGNGEAILFPTLCEVEETLNGAWTFTMQHPIDPEGKWKLLQMRNIVQINGQLFTILDVEEVYSNNSGYIRCSGEHIFYQQNDSWIFPGDPIEGDSGWIYIYRMNARTERKLDHAAMAYDFAFASDISIGSGGKIIKDTKEGCTPIEALIGTGGLIDQSDTGCAELYRDNFYYSINYRMEGARDNAFDIRVGRDLTGITRRQDTSQFVSYFGCYDKWDNYWAVSWVISSFVAGRYFPHHIIRTKTFSDIDACENGWAALINPGKAFFRRNCKPVIGYDIDLEDVRNNPDFSMVINSERLKVGDTGTVCDKRLGDPNQGYKLTLKISGTTYDAVKNKIIRVTIGDQAHFSSPSASTIEIEPEVVAGNVWISDADGAFILDADGKRIFQEVTNG